MFGAMAVEGIHYVMYLAEVERRTIDKAQAALSPEAFKEWQAERVAARRHRELCQAIERAGENARPRGIGLFW